MVPSKLFHGTTTAFRTNRDVKVPYGFYKFSNGHICKTSLEPLMPLQFENEFQIFALHPIVQKSVVSYFLESGWHHMHQIASDEFFIF